MQPSLKWVVAYPMLDAVFHDCSEKSILPLIFSLLASHQIDIYLLHFKMRTLGNAIFENYQ
jgi:hypothetical protein